MKLISLNVWGGKQFGELMAFINSHKDSTDIFCFQEVFSNNVGIEDSRGVRANLFQEFSVLLSDHVGYFDLVVHGEDADGAADPRLWYGLAIFVRRKLTVVDSDSIEIFSPSTRNSTGAIHRRTLQCLTVDNGTQYYIGNVHGLHTGAGKEDTPERLVQSERIRDNFAKQICKKVLCGDFNLLPNTESVKILEKGMINLITSYHIKTTRSKHYTKPAKFADYTFVSPNVRIKSFIVPYVEASDHLPMILEFD